MQSKSKSSSGSLSKPRSQRPRVIPTSSQSVDNGIKILEIALKKGLSPAAAAKLNGKGKNYVYAIHEKIDNHKNEKRITREQHSRFNDLYKQVTR